jgi:hypothetical protein
MPDDAITSLPFTFLNPYHDWQRACAGCKEIITKGQEGIGLEKIYLLLGETSLRVYRVWHDGCQEKYLEDGESCESP